jgi:hypothetical protein
VEMALEALFLIYDIRIPFKSLHKLDFAKCIKNKKPPLSLTVVFFPE